MRYLFKITLLIIIMTLTSATVSADKYSRAWEKVDDLIKKDLPKKAAEEINAIWDMAAREDNSRQMLKSAVYLTRVDQSYGENSINNGIELFKTLLPKLKVKEHQALCHAFLAQGYISYKDRTNLQRNRETDLPNPPMDMWTVRMITDTICYHLDQSIKLAGDVASGYYEDFFPGSNKAGLKLRPGLMDLLMDNAIVSLTPARLIKGKRSFFNDKRLYGSGADYLSAVSDLGPDDPDLWQFYVIKCLTKHNITSKPSIRTTIDLRRMELLSQALDVNFEGWSDNHETWLEGCLALADSYEKKVKFSTMFYAMAARMLDTKMDELEDDPERQVSMRKLEHDICIKAQKKWPKSEGAFDCFKIKADMEQTRLAISQDRNLVAGERNIAKISYSNATTVYFKVVEVSGQIKDLSNREVLPMLNAITPVAEWSMRLNDPGDWLEHYALVDIPPVMQGNYYFMASSGPYFGSNDQIMYQYLECNNLGLARMTAQNGTISCYTVNLKTGKPVGSCRYTVWQTNYQDELISVATRGISDDDGFISIDGLRNGLYKIEIDKGENKGNCILSVPWVSDMPDRNTIRIYTDRYTYLPGDSVQFTGVAYFSDGYERGRVLKDMTLDISFFDINYKTIDKIRLTTDSLGVIKGSFNIPDNVVPGRATLMASCNDDDVYCHASVNIESFRQPKFQVTLDKLTETPRFDREIEITGHAISFTDFPVDGAQVEWTAGVSSYSVHPFCIRDNNNLVRIANGEIKTDGNGLFRLGFTVSEDILLNQECQVTVSVTVTDLNGETHDSKMYFNVGAENKISVSSKPVNDESGLGYEFYLNLISNNPVNGQVKFKVERVMYDPKLLPLPFALYTDKMKQEIARIVDEQNIRDRFNQYDFDFDKEPAVAEVMFDNTVKVGADQSGIVRLKGLKSGIYRITASADNSAGYKDYLVVVQKDDRDFVPGSEYLWCSDSDVDVEHKAEVGDTVTLQVSSCLPDAVIYYFVENRFGMCGRGYVLTDGKQQTISIPVTQEMKGQFAVQLGLVYKGYSESKSISYKVEDRKKQLDIELVTFRNMLEPDSREEWTLKVTDKLGNPVKAALMLDMYDSALDRYGLNRWTFMPWNSVFISTESLFQAPTRYFERYYPLGVNTSLAEYKGKKAITGTLINPFTYYVARPSKGLRLRGASSAVRSLEMNEFGALGITTVDEALQGRVAGLDVVFDSGNLGARQNAVALKEETPMLSDADNNMQDFAPVTLRTDMNPTGLFEYLVTDKDGYATIKFNAPQLLTSWHLQGIAYTDSLKTARFEETVVTRKLLMLEPSAPRFLRQGDRMEFTVKVSNLTDEAVNAKVALTLTDAVTGKALKIIEGAQSKMVKIPAQGNAGTGFTINVPAGLTAVTYRITAQTTGHSDGMQETIPVLSSRTRVVQSLSLFNNGNEKRTFRFEELTKPRSSTIADEQLTLEYSATPIWYAIQALPSMICLDDPSNLRLFHRYMGAVISDNLNSRYPSIRKMLDEWAQLPASEWQTQLERNQKLTGTLLEETPWLRSSQCETDRLRHLAKSLGTQEMADVMQDAFTKLCNAQQADGGWPWMDGLSSDSHITDEILQGLGLLIENGVLKVTPELKQMIQRGLDYLDAYFYKIYAGDYKPNSLNNSQLSYLMTRSYFLQYPFSNDTRASYSYFVGLAQKEDTHNMNLYFRAQLALLMARQGKAEQAKHIAETLLERSLYSDEMGRYWRDNQAGLLWHEAPIETQSLIIRLLLATGNKTQAVEAARWLLKQKQTTGWNSSPATAAAVTALMATGGDVQLESDPDVTIYVGKDAVKASESKATAGYTTRTWDGPISRDKADITVDSKTPGISWGGIFRSFTEEMDKVEHSENGMNLKRTVWRVVNDSQGERLEEVKSGTKLRVGDRLKIQFDLTTDRNLEYLELSDMRAATMEPTSTWAGYRRNWRDGIGYYVAPGNTRNVFYIDRLNKGSYRIEYEVYVQKPGRFQEGIAVMQCLYAPAFRATTPSFQLTVE